ncbi:GAF and ANTAR domain-containing protein [Kribbella hippodromi]|uniref:GAF and ANTAR domain-containing protein n=1 Tax=Kribbella hippodromi TaxID=434347 RepID=UPI0031D1CFAF
MDRAAVLRRLGKLVAASQGSPRFADRVCAASEELVGGQGSSINVSTDDPGRRMTVVSTDEVAARLESLQDVLGEGPAWDAYRWDEPVIADLTDDLGRRWPEFTRSAIAATGPIRLHCFPMHPAGRPFGVYSVYAYGELREGGDVVQFMADTVGAVLLRDASDLPLDDRSALYQATGMTAVQLGASVEDALAMLRAHAFAQDATLNEIAEQVVDRQIDFRDS